MGLPWFSFNIKDFLANTCRLNTEAKGAYLLLILDYYEHGEGPPDDDEVLATITGLPLEVWKHHRKVIRPLFDTVTDSVTGTITHSRIDAEIAWGIKRHGQRMKSLDAAMESRGKKPRKAPKRAPATIPVTEMVTDTVTAPPTVPVTDPGTHLHQHKQIEEEVSYDTSSARTQEAGLDTILPSDFTLTAADVIRCQSEGYSFIEVGEIIDRFKKQYLLAGSFSDDWPAMWWRFWDRMKPAQLPKAKPRIEVSSRPRKAKGFPIPPDWKPNARHAEMCAERGIHLDDLEETFRDYCGQPANREKYSDHDGAFRTFIKNQPGFNRGARPNAQTPSRGSITEAGDQAIAELNRRIAEAENDHGSGDEVVQELPQDRLRAPAGGAGDDGDGA